MNAYLLALLSLLNMLSPQNTLPIFNPYSPPTNSPFFQTSALMACPIWCKLLYAFSTSSVIHVPACPFRFTILHSWITCWNARFILNSNAFCFSNCFMLCEIFNCSGKMTNLGSGLHHRICSPSYHGKMPFLYAVNNLCVERSPPMASNPSGSARWTGGNEFSSSRIKIGKRVWSLKFEVWGLQFEVWGFFGCFRSRLKQCEIE